MYTLIQQGCIKLIKSDSKHIYIDTKNKKMLWFWTFYNQRILKKQTKKQPYDSFHKTIKQHICCQH